MIGGIATSAMMFLLLSTYVGHVRQNCGYLFCFQSNAENINYKHMRNDQSC